MKPQKSAQVETLFETVVAYRSLNANEENTGAAGVHICIADAVQVASYGRAWVVSAGQAGVVDAEKLVTFLGRLSGAVLSAFQLLANLFRAHGFLLLGWAVS